MKNAEISPTHLTTSVRLRCRIEKKKGWDGYLYPLGGKARGGPEAVLRGAFIPMTVGSKWHSVTVASGTCDSYRNWHKVM